MCDQEALQIHQINASNETLDTILMIIKIPEKTDEEMVSRLQKNNVMTITLTQMMDEVQHV